LAHQKLITFGLAIAWWVSFQ